MNQVDGPGEEQSRSALRRHRLYATAMLLAMAALFVAMKVLAEPGFWTSLVIAGAEAAMVGGLADWFAVTALFRRPLGLPIPHTAIIPRNKDRIGEGIARFVEGNFLSPELVAAKLRSLGLAAGVGRWLSEAGNARMVAERTMAAAPFAMESLQDRQVRDFIRGALSEQLRQVEAAPVAGRLLAVLTESGHHHALFERALVLLRRYLLEREDLIYRQVSERSHWLIPKTVDRKIAEAILSGVEDLLRSLANPDHEIRRRFDQAVSETTERLQHDPRYRQRGEEIKEELLGSPMVQDYLASLWDRLREAVLADLGGEPSRLRQAVAEAVQGLGRALAADAAMQARLDRRIEQFVLSSVVPHRREIGSFIEEVVRGWDVRTVTEKMELAVGRDLQYIRMNGTIVGALVGCALYLISVYAF